MSRNSDTDIEVEFGLMFMSMMKFSDEKKKNILKVNLKGEM